MRSAAVRHAGEKISCGGAKRAAVARAKGTRSKDKIDTNHSDLGMPEADIAQACQRLVGRVAVLFRSRFAGWPMLSFATGA